MKPWVDGFTVHFSVPALWNSSPLQISYPYPGVLVALKVLFELGWAPLAWCDREVFEYFW